jgi:2-oxoisovalerate dehydrogenase E1 component
LPFTEFNGILLSMNSVTTTGLRTLTYDRTGCTDELLLDLYEAILLPRMIEEKMLLLLRQGKLSKWFSGIGQEAIAVGCTKALAETDYIFPLHRNLGVFTARNLPLEKLFAQWEGKQSGYSKGRERSFHFGAPEHRIIGMISHLGAMLPVADGVALASNLDGADTIALAFSGDGGTSEGDFHEAVNVAAVWDLPVIFLIENNGYGLSTPTSEQYRCKQLIDKAIGYGIEGIRVDGNNILEVYKTTRRIAEKMRRDRKPVLLEAITFRMRGHEEASGTKYVPPHLFEAWKKKDPVINYEQYLVEIGLLTSERIERIRARFKERIEEAWEKTRAEPATVCSVEAELADVYAPLRVDLVPPREELAFPDTKEQQPRKRFVDAIAEGLRQAMERDPKLILMGQDIAEYGGVFKVTEGLVQRFGKDRVRNTPLCESAILGAALGLAIAGRASMVEMQFADFVTCGFNQIVNNLAKTHYRWGQSVNVTIRMPTGAGVGAGPFHSQSNEAWFAHVPGLKIAYPATPFDAKGLLTTSLIDPNPVLFFEHKYLYRSVEGFVPDEYYNLPFGKARIIQQGDDVTIVAYGAAVHWVTALAANFPDVGIEIIDLRTLVPWDRETVLNSIEKTGKCLIVHEDTLTGGIGGEIAATIQEERFHALDAPVMRVASLDTPVPFNLELEQQFLAKSRLQQTLEKLIAY